MEVWSIFPFAIKRMFPYSFENKRMRLLTCVRVYGMPIGNKLKWPLKEWSGYIFESCDISFENTPTSPAISLVLFM